MDILLTDELVPESQTAVLRGPRQEELWSHLIREQSRSGNIHLHTLDLTRATGRMRILVVGANQSGFGLLAVAADTVDYDIYNMQERKAKMNAAIMESKDERQERKAMLKAAVDRFVDSPHRNKR